MVAAMAGIKMIPPFIDTCGEAIRALPIREDGSALLAVPPAPYWQVRAVYAEQGTNAHPKRIILGANHIRSNLATSCGEIKHMPGAIIR